VYFSMPQLAINYISDKEYYEKHHGGLP